MKPLLRHTRVLGTEKKLTLKQVSIEEEEEEHSKRECFSSVVEEDG